MRKLGCFFKALRNRKLTSREDLRDDLRKLGLVWIGAGLITFVVQDNWIGIIPFLVGSILLFFGLTQPTESQTFEDHNNE